MTTPDGTAAGDGTTPPHVGRIERARRRVGATLGRFERRVAATREALSPSRLVEDPWVRVGLAFAVGFAAGQARDTAVVRAAVRVLLTAGLRQLLRVATEPVR